MNGNPLTLFGAPAAANGGVCIRADRGVGRGGAFPPVAPASARSAGAVLSRSVSQVPLPRSLSEESPEGRGAHGHRQQGHWLLP